MGRSNKVERVEAAWREATGCASPGDAREKIERITRERDGQAGLVLIAIQAKQSGRNGPGFGVEPGDTDYV